jgi:hypothetical protein
MFDKINAHEIIIHYNLRSLQEGFTVLRFLTCKRFLKMVHIFHKTSQFFAKVAYFII